MDPKFTEADNQILDGLKASREEEAQGEQYVRIMEKFDLAQKLIEGEQKAKAELEKRLLNRMEKITELHRAAEVDALLVQKLTVHRDELLRKNRDLEEKNEKLADTLEEVSDVDY